MKDTSKLNSALEEFEEKIRKKARNRIKDYDFVPELELRNYSQSLIPLKIEEDIPDKMKQIYLNVYNYILRYYRDSERGDLLDYKRDWKKILNPKDPFERESNQEDLELSFYYASRV